MKTIPRYLSCAALMLLLQSCATTAPPLAFYDFGALPKADGAGTGTCALPPIQLSDMSSPVALDSNLMLYRLLYDNDQQSHAYASHRWSMTPAQLLGLRIRSQLAASQVKIIDSGMVMPGLWQLRLDLTDFAQYFSDATHSTAQLAVRVSVLRANTLVGQTTLQQQSPAAHPDAPSGAQAMRVASDALITDLNNWLCKLPRP